MKVIHSGLSEECPTKWLCCGTDCCEVFYLALCHPAIRDFLQHPRVMIEPATWATYEGSEVVRFRLLDLSESSTLAVMVHPQMLHVLAQI